MRYIQYNDGEGFTVKNKVNERIACCDCGLVHDFVFVVPGMRKGKKIGVAGRRNARSTAAMRRQMKKGD